MRLKKLILLFIAVCFLAVGIGYSVPQKAKLSRKERKEVLKNLPRHYQEWLNMTYHISTESERKVFLSLDSERDRAIFVRSFWLQRDPTPGTLENEYKKEIEERYAYVEKYFKRGSSKPGWMTDMGRFYMLLGKPNSIERFDSKPGLYPAQVWYYFGDKSLGLPTYFSVMYFKPNNMTEWRFYNPSVDGPAALLIQTDLINENNYEAIYEKLKELAPELAMPAITMIPNEIAPGFRPPLRNNLIVSNIHEAPKRKINTSYATHFLNYKGFVDIESSANYITSNKTVSVTRYRRFEFSFINVSIKPQKISVGYSEDKDQYYFSYDVSISLKDGEKTVYEEKKHYDFYIDNDKVNNLKGNGMVIHHAFPATPGKYNLTVFAMNGVGKEFTYFDKYVEVPSLTGGPVLATPVIGYKAENNVDDFFFPYHFNDQKLYVDASDNLRLRETPLVLLGAYNLDKATWEKGKIQLVVKGLNERNKYNKTYVLPLSGEDFNPNINILKKIGEAGFDPDYYELEIQLINGAGTVLDTKSANFSVSPVSNFAYPMETFKKMRVENPFFFFYCLATQYENSGNLEEADTYYSKSLGNNPDFLDARVQYLSLLNKRRKYTQVMVDVEKLKGHEKYQLEYHLAKATALFGMKDFKEAQKQLMAANSVYDSDTRVLNLLGYTYLNLKETAEAITVFEASMRLNDIQPQIRKALDEIKKLKK